MMELSTNGILWVWLCSECCCSICSPCRPLLAPQMFRIFCSSNLSICRSTFPKLSSVLQRALLKDRMESLLAMDGGIVVLLENQQVEDLQRLYRLFGLLDNGHQPIADRFRTYVYGTFSLQNWICSITACMQAKHDCKNCHRDLRSAIVAFILFRSRRRACRAAFGSARCARWGSKRSKKRQRFNSETIAKLIDSAGFFKFAWRNQRPFVQMLPTGFALSESNQRRQVTNVSWLVWRHVNSVIWFLHCRWNTQSSISTRFSFWQRAKILWTKISELTQ